MEKDSQQLHRRGSDTSALAALGRAQRKRAERRKSRRDFPEPTTPDKKSKRKSAIFDSRAITAEGIVIVKPTSDDEGSDRPLSDTEAETSARDRHKKKKSSVGSSKISSSIPSLARDESSDALSPRRTPQSAGSEISSAFKQLRSKSKSKKRKKKLKEKDKEKEKPAQKDSNLVNLMSLSNFSDVEDEEELNEKFSRPRAGGKDAFPISPRRLTEGIISVEAALETVLSALMSNSVGVPLKDRKWMFKKIEDAFVGTEAVDWLREHCVADVSRSNAALVCQYMLERGYVKPATSEHGSFTDEYAFYQFTAKAAECKKSGEKPIPEMLSLSIRYLVDVCALNEGPASFKCSPGFERVADAESMYKDQDDIQFVKDKTSGEIVVLCGTLDKLLERLTSEKFPDVNFRKIFMLVYQTMISGEELLVALDQRWNVSAPTFENADAVKKWQITQQKPIRLRVMNVLRTWLDVQPHVFADNPNLKASFEKLIERVRIGLGNMPAEQLISALERKVEACTSVSEVARILEGLPSSNKRKSSSSSSDAEMLADIIGGLHPDVGPANAFSLASDSLNLKECAEQMTLLHHDIFCDIMASELQESIWLDKKRKRKCAPNVLRMIDSFNELSLGIVTQIVCQLDLKTRVKALQRSLGLMKELFELKNFSGCYAVLAGITSSPVKRLKKTWAEVDIESLDRLSEYKDTFSSDRNYHNLRGVLNNVALPCVPHIGVYLTDLALIHEGNADQLNGMINFFKRQNAGMVIDKLLNFQSVKYDYTPNANILDQFAKITTLEDKLCFKLSQRLEPRDPIKALEQSLVAEINLSRRLSEAEAEVERLKAENATLKRPAPEDKKRTSSKVSNSCIRERRIEPVAAADQIDRSRSLMVEMVPIICVQSDVSAKETESDSDPLFRTSASDRSTGDKSGTDEDPPPPPERRNQSSTEERDSPVDESDSERPTSPLPAPMLTALYNEETPKPDKCHSAAGGQINAVVTSTCRESEMQAIIEKSTEVEQRTSVSQVDESENDSTTQEAVKRRLSRISTDEADSDEEEVIHELEEDHLLESCLSTMEETREVMLNEATETGDSERKGNQADERGAWDHGDSGDNNYGGSIDGHGAVREGNIFAIASAAAILQDSRAVTGIQNSGDAIEEEVKVVDQPKDEMDEMDANSQDAGRADASLSENDKESHQEANDNTKEKTEELDHGENHQTKTKEDPKNEGTSQDRDVGESKHEIKEDGGRAEMKEDNAANVPQEIDCGEIDKSERDEESSLDVDIQIEKALGEIEIASTSLQKQLLS